MSMLKCLCLWYPMGLRLECARAAQMFYHQVSCAYCTPEHQPGIGDDDDNVDGVEVMVTSFISLWEETSCNDKQHSGLRFIALCSCETLNRRWHNDRFSETPHCIICDALSILIVIVIMVMVILQRGSKRWNPFGKQKTCEQPHPGSRKKTPRQPGHQHLMVMIKHDLQSWS